MKEETWGTKPYIGVAYCPYAKSGDTPAENWGPDIATMKKLNINILRCFVAWDRIEIDKDVFKFDSLDRIFSEAEVHGMKILLNLGGTLTQYVGIYPPRYLLREKGIQETVREGGKILRQFGPFRELCLNNPYYHDRAMSFIKRVCRRYCNHPALEAWSLWNEPFYQQNGCFCPVCLKKFRKFLSLRYEGDIERLNAAWGTEFPVFYQSFDEVEPGTVVSFLSGGYVSSMDFLAFNRRSLESRLVEIRKIIDDNDPLKHPVTINVAVTGAYGKYAEPHSYPSIFDQNRHVDIPGFSAYTHLATLENENPNLMGFANAWIRSSGKDPDLGFWALEGEAGQYSKRTSHHALTEKGWRQAANWQLVSQGAKMLMFWKFGGRNSDTQTTGFNLAGYDGAITERAQRLSQFAEKFYRLQNYFLPGKVRSEAAIWMSDAMEYASICDGAYGTFIENCQGAFEMMQKLHFNCDVMDDTILNSDRIFYYKVILVPSATFMHEKSALRLIEFVQKGGSIIVDRTFGMKNDRSLHFRTIPGFGLQALTGAFINDDTFAENPETIRLGSAETDISDQYHSHINIIDASPVGFYSDGGKCALSIKRHGKGLVVYWGVDIFRLMLTSGAERKAVLEKTLSLLNVIGMESGIEVFDDHGFQLQTGTLELPDRSKTWFLINFSMKELNCGISFKECGKYFDILNDVNYEGEKMQTHFKPYETRILRKQG